MKIGLTGGIGSGKTLVADIFRHLGIAIFEADTEAKWLLENDSEISQIVKNQFGAHLFQHGKLKKQLLANMVFRDPQALKQLNEIIHPAVKKRFRDWAGKQIGPYVIEEAAILFESGSNKYMDKTILVDAPVNIRIERTIQRDQITREQVLDRMNNQWPTEKIKPLADFIVLNNGKQLLLPQIQKIDTILRQQNSSI